MIRFVRAFVCVALVHLSLSIALSAPAAVRAPKTGPVLTDASAGFHASLVRRFRARRRVARARAMPAVLAGTPDTVPLILSFALPQPASAPPLAPSAPPDHPPA